MLQQLRTLAPGVDVPLRCVVAWSGGLDSTVLLHALLAAKRRWPAQLAVRALHVDHHLQAASARFRAHCLAMARRWRVPLAILDAAIALAKGASVEEQARQARYALFVQALRPGELLLSAQHADDQMETVLLALLRGAGPAGLAAMPAASALGSGRLLRPLLECERAQLEQYAVAHGLPWIEDPSNAQQRFDRNYLRASVLPPLRQRWPAAARTIARSARHSAVAAASLMQSAQRDAQAAADGPDLEIAVLRRWSPARCKAALRAWFAAASYLPPDERRLEQIQLLMDARADANPSLVLPDVVVRRHAGRLILDKPALQSPAADTGARRGAARPWSWQRGAWQSSGGRLAVRPERHGDLDLDQLPADLCVVFAPGSSVAVGRGARKLLQELQVPAWERDRLPLLCAAVKSGNAGRLLAIADLWLHPGLRSGENSRRRGRIFWQEQR